MFIVYGSVIMTQKGHFICEEQVDIMCTAISTH